VFPGGANVKALADRAIEEGLITAKEEVDKSKKKPKKVVYALITERGIQRVMDADSPKAALEALLPAVQALGKPSDQPEPEAFRIALASATETCVAAIRQAFSQLEGEVLKALGPAPTFAVDARPLLNSLQRALECVRVSAPPTGPSAAAPRPDQAAASASALEEAIVTFVRGWAKAKAVGCTFDILWDHLRGQNSELTIGAFQDALRKLHQAGRIRLSGWPRMLDDLPQPHLALFVSSKVMYYAQPACSNG